MSNCRHIWLIPAACRTCWYLILARFLDPPVESDKPRTLLIAQLEPHSSDYFSFKFIRLVIELNRVWIHYSTGHSSSFLFSSPAPINIAYTNKHKYALRDGYYFSVAPGYYKAHHFGIRLKNVFEVIDTHDRVSFSGAKFLTFRVATLVPFETKLIDRTLLSSQEVRWWSWWFISRNFLLYFCSLPEKMAQRIQRENSRDCGRWIKATVQDARVLLADEPNRAHSWVSDGIGIPQKQHRQALNQLLHLLRYCHH